jgi:hypothetical protein
MQGELARSDARPDVILWIEALARGLGCETGSRTIELRLEGGRFRAAYLHAGPFNAAALSAMFEWPEPPSCVHASAHRLRQHEP